MNDLDKTREQLLEEIIGLKQKLSKSEKLEKNLKAINQQAKANEQKLRAANQQLEAILDHMPGLVFFKDKKGTFIKVNKYVADAHHMLKEELENKSTFDLYLKDQAQAYLKDDLKVIESGKPKLFIEEPWETEEGKKWVSTSKIPFVDEHGEIIGIIGISNDITERKQAEETLLKSEERYRLFVDNASDAFYLLDMEGRVIDVNLAACTTLGYSREELLKLTILDVDVNFQPDNISEAMESLTNDEAQLFESVHKKKDGNVFPVEVRIRRFGSKENQMHLSLVRDITYRKQAEKVVLESEKKYKLLFESMAQGVFYQSANGSLFDVNQAALDMFGLTHNQFIGRDSNDSEWKVVGEDGSNLPPDKHPSMVALNTGEEVRNTVIGVFNPKSNKYNWLNVNVKPQFRNSEKKPYQVFVTLHDITERKQSEEQLIQKNEQLELVLQGASLGWWDWDITSGKEIYNEILPQNIGYKLNEIEPHIKWWEDKIHPADQKQVSKDLQKHFDGNTDYYINKHRLKTKTGEWKWFIDHGRVVERDKTGKPIRMVGTLRDIDKQERAEKLTRESLHQIEVINANTPIIIWKSDIDKNGNFINTYISKIADNFLALPVGTINNSWDKFFSYVKPEYLPELNKIIKQGITNPGTILSLDYEVKKANGDIAWFSSKGRAIINNNELTLYGSTIDVTVSKQKEIELIAAKERAEESDRLKSAFLSNMSHEIRTPMNGILGFINLLDNPDLSAAKKQEFTNIIQKSSDRLLTTINDLIDISKIEAGQVEVNGTETSINTLLAELHAFFTPEANSKGLTLTSLPTLSFDRATVFTDSDKLHGILINLIKNAIKYTKRGRVTFGYIQNYNFIEFFVEDTGIGVPKGRQHAIFNRFEQADIGDVKVFEGSGLGLAIAKAYVEMLGGKIWMTSEESVGSKFMFTIPYIAKPVQKIEPIGDATKGTLTNEVFENTVVLIAEDEDVSTLYFEETLRNMFREIIYVKTGKEAIETCKSNPEINIVLMDIKMPVMNGYEATREIRKFNKDLIIIAQTAYAQTGDREKALDAGCNDYISKPIKKEILIEKIKGLVKN